MTGDRRAEMAAEITARTGIDDAMIERLVRRFYERVRADALLGPIFEARIANWEAHMRRIDQFWLSAALMSGDYSGNPTARHAPLPVDAEHFDRWLALFEDTARDVCPPAAAEHFVHRARLIADGLELGVAARHGETLRPGERFHRTADTPEDS